MNDSDKFVQDALESLRFEGEPGREVVQGTRETVLANHGREIRRSTLGRRAWIGGAFVVALGLGAAAGPRVLEWWEHIVLTVDEELPDGSHHVVLEDDEGNAVFDDTLAPDEALIQIEPDGEQGGEILRVAPAPEPPQDGQVKKPQ